LDQIADVGVSLTATQPEHKP